MNWKPNRQHVLLGLLALVGVARVGDWMLTAVISGPLQARTAQAATLRSQIKDREKLLSAVRTQGLQIEDWGRQSLPSNLEVARTLYRSWLMDRLSEAHLSNPHVDSGNPISRGGLYHTLPFTVRGQGTVTELTKFLFQFTHSGQLHAIQSMTLNPIGASGRLDIAATIEALAIPGADRTDQLSTQRAQRLASTNPQAYGVISDRHLFGGGSDVAPAEHTVVTAITRSRGVLQVWITRRNDDTVLKLRVNDRFTIGDFHGRIVHILDQDVVIDSDGEHWLVAIGESVSDGFAIPADLLPQAATREYSP